MFRMITYKDIGLVAAVVIMIITLIVVLNCNADKVVYRYQDRSDPYRLSENLDTLRTIHGESYFDIGINTRKFFDIDGKWRSIPIGQAVVNGNFTDTTNEGVVVVYMFRNHANSGLW